MPTCASSAHTLCASQAWPRSSLLDELINANVATPTERIHAALPCFGGPSVPAVERRGDDCRGVFDEVVLPEGLVASLGQENLENICDCSRRLRRCFLQRLAKHALWIEVGCSGCGVG